jgi:hypothetical protein
MEQFPRHDPSKLWGTWALLKSSAGLSVAGRATHPDYPLRVSLRDHWSAPPAPDRFLWIRIIFLRKDGTLADSR